MTCNGPKLDDLIGGMTNRFEVLERAGLVECRPDAADRRGKLIALADSGKRVIEMIGATSPTRNVCCPC